MENRGEKDTDGDPFEFGAEKAAMLEPDVIARKAGPLPLQSPSEAIFRPAEFDVVLLKLFPHSREGIQIGNPSRPNAGVTGDGASDGSPVAQVLALPNREVTCPGTRPCVSRGTRGTLPSHRPSRRGGCSIPPSGQTPRQSASRLPPPRIA